MLGLRKAAEPQTVEAYVSALERGLRRHLPRDKADAITQETHAHLTDRVEELTGRGVAQHEAESVAVAGWGSAQTYARSAVENAYSDRYSCRIRWMGRAAIVGMLFLPLLQFVLPANLYQPWERSVFSGFLLSGFLLTAIAASLGARMPQTRAYSVIISFACVFAFVTSGFRYVPYDTTPPVLVSGFEGTQIAYYTGPGLPRDDYREDVAALKQSWVYREIALLEQGIAVYQSGADVPASLRYEGGFIVPKEVGWQWCSDHKDALAFQDWPIRPLRTGVMRTSDWRAVASTLPYRTVATRDEAARIWAKTGAQWLAAKHRVRERTEHVCRVMERTQGADWGFNLGAATYYGSRGLPLFVILLVPDFLLAHLGRAIWIASRNARSRNGRTA